MNSHKNTKENIIINKENNYKSYKDINTNIGNKFIPNLKNIIELNTKIIQ